MQHVAVLFEKKIANTFLIKIEITYEQRRKERRKGGRKEGRKEGKKTRKHPAVLFNK